MLSIFIFSVSFASSENQELLSNCNKFFEQQMYYKAQRNDSVQRYCKEFGFEHKKFKGRCIEAFNQQFADQTSYDRQLSFFGDGKNIIEKIIREYHLLQCQKDIIGLDKSFVEKVYKKQMKIFKQKQREEINAPN